MAYHQPHPAEVPVVSARFGDPRSATLAGYLDTGGYAALAKVLGLNGGEPMPGAAIIEEVKKSSLRGRGGAGFPTGLKWSFIPQQSPKPKYVLCNADESEPGTCKDRLILEHDPFAVIEGVTLAGRAIGAARGFIYIRGEYRYLFDIMQRALAEAYAGGYLGADIRGSGWGFD
ncbi:MAG: NADH-quinone oxidoreductase subunit F, partial [Terriglobales bacterium]